MLRIREVFHRFGGLIALNNLSLEINQGELVGLMGPNGAGKTTLFNIITGFISPVSGSVYLEGEEITHLSPHVITQKGLVRTFQDVRVFEHLTVVENVEVAIPEGRGIGLLGGIFPTLKTKFIKEFVKEKAMEYIGMVGLSSVAGKRPDSLTFGQQRLLGIARAIALRPKMLLLDEPSAGLNQDETIILSEVIRKIHLKGVTIFIIEHDIGMLLDLAQRIVVLDRGKKIMEGTPEKIRGEKSVIEAYFGKKRKCLV